MIEFKNVSFTYPERETAVFTNLSIKLPAGVVSLIGQNATGKSTLLLLSGGRLIPDSGDVIIDSHNTRDFASEQDRAEYAAFVYQNMEFETDEPVGALLTYVYENGFHAEKDLTFIDELVEVFELERFMDRKTQELSKGELQRIILAFSILCGSRFIMMDEPIFSLEDYQKKRALEYMTSYARKKKIGLYFSLHELDLSEKYSDHIMLFRKNAPPEIGLTKELFSREIIETAYEVPFDMLKGRETLYRDGLISIEEKRHQ
ncbi:MAG: ABC transporter ATP-binding protein [Spirochaetaceae bacterium]|nr:MAG: ABC transporter ATP-binding protein [Spirochaetaceae bacterium]